MDIKIIKILNGHISPETAYVVEDYPYGYTLRCTIRYWLETATKGSAKGADSIHVPDHQSQEGW